MSRDHYFEIDTAGKNGQLSVAFDIANQVFSEGKDLIYFVEGLTEHFRNILHIKLAGRDAPHLSASEEERGKYLLSAAMYSQEQCLTILDYLIQALGQIRFSPSGRFALESILLFILRIHQRIPIDVLVHKLADIEQRLQGHTPIPSPVPVEAVQKQPEIEQNSKIEPAPKPPEKPIIVAPKQPEFQAQKQIITPSLQEDPDPKPSEIIKPKVVKQASVPAPVPEVKTAGPSVPHDMSKQCHYDTIMQFTAVELEGKLDKKIIKK